ncbi:MAG: ATP-binding cassette domain-containing protein [Bacteroidetes bacterium]|nr:ATP-binding cassette domain-containing protein [Bacteroidota bacterium]
MIKVAIKEITLNKKRTLLSNVDFELEKNSIFTILGLNGSGKSTLIKSLTGLLNPRLYEVNGSVNLDGKNIFSIDYEELLQLRKDKIKYVFQDAVNSFDHLKTLQYYFEKLVKDKNEIDALLEYFLLPKYTELQKLYPYEVSGGMAQRINFVLALLCHPQILILDEPTSGIDLAISNLFLLRLKEFAKEKDNSALLVTHDLVFAKKISNKIAFLSNGKLSRFYSNEEFFSAHDSKTLELFLNAHKQISL